MPEHRAEWNEDGTTLFIKELKPYSYPQKWTEIWRGSGTEAERKLLASLGIQIPVKPHECPGKINFNGSKHHCQLIAPHGTWHRWQDEVQLVRIEWQ